MNSSIKIAQIVEKYHNFQKHFESFEKAVAMFRADNSGGDVGQLYGRIKHEAGLLRNIIPHVKKIPKKIRVSLEIKDEDLSKIERSCLEYLGTW